MKNILVLSILLIFMQSCSNYRKSVTSVPDYALNTDTREDLIEGGKLSLPSDSTQNIIVYNVIEKKETKTRLSDETWRFFIGQFFTTVTTILTIIAVESSPSD